MSDRDLLHAYESTGSETAFAALVERHLGLVYSVALRQVGGDAHLAKDVTQSVFIDLAQKAQRLPATIVLAGWLYTSARFAAAKIVRSEQRRRANERTAQLMKENESDAGDLAWRKIRPALDDALSTLATEDREAVILRFFDNRSYREIGDELSLKEDTARVRVERALQKLANALQRRGIASTAQALTLALSANAAIAAPAGLATTITANAFQVAHASAGAAAIKTLTLMSATKTIGAATAAAVVVLLALQLQSLRRETESLRNLSDQLNREAIALQNRSPQPSAPSVSTATRSAAPNPLASGYSDRNLLGEPAYAASIARRHRRYAMANYRHVIDTLNLSPSETAQLKELIAERWLAGEDVGDVFDRMNEASRDLREKAVAEAKANAEQKIKELLGPERYAKFQENERSRTAASGNWILITDFWDSGVPLSAEQKEKLARVFFVERESNPPGRDTSPINPQTLLRDRDRQVLESATPFLSPEQLALLRDRRMDDNRYRLIVREREASSAQNKEAR